MTIMDSILHIIKENAALSVPIAGNSNLYTDLGFDSLSFITMLVEIEEAYAVTFDITEMEACLEVGRLIAAVQDKMKERCDDQAFTVESGKLG